MKGVLFILLVIIISIPQSILANFYTDSSLSKTNIKLTDGTSPYMTNESLEIILKQNGSIIEGRRGYWQVKYKERLLTIITDPTHNRMRIITAIIEKKDIKKAQYAELLEAQFDRILDVKYALYNDVLWAAFIHPLKELTEEQVIDALSQVYYAANNFGGSYRSTDLQFGNRED